MPYDPEQLAVDVEYLTTLPQWQDEAKRPEFIRQVALQAGPNLDPQAHGEFANALWERSKGNVLQRGAEFVARGGEEVLKSIPASGGAAVFAAADALGITDTGSGTRLKRGVADLVDATGQRLKQLGGGEILGMNLLPGQSKQAVRDQTLDALKQSLDQGLYPAGLERWMTGEFDAGDVQPDAETQQWIDLMTRGIAERAVAADHMGKVKPEKVREWLQSDRNPAFAKSDIPGEPGPRELLADYLATRDPSSWEAFQARVSETDSQRTTRLRRFAAEGDMRATTATMPEGLGKDLAVRSMDMQTSPIDLASAALPIFRGRAALQAARRGGAGAQMLRGMGAEGLQEGATEYLSDPNASPERVLEAAGLGAVGQGVVSAPMAGAGALLRRRDNLSTNDPTTSPNQTPASPQPPAPGQPGAPAPMAPGAPGPAAVSPLIGIAQRGGAVDVTLPEDTGELTAEEVQDLETGRRQPILQGVPDRPQQVAPFRESSINEEPIMEGDAITDLRIPRSPQAIAESQRIEAERQQKIATMRMLDARAQGMPLIPDSPSGSRDILDFANENPIYLPPGFSEERNLPEYEKLKEAKLPPYWRQFVASSKRGGNPSDVAQRAFDAGFIDAPTADAYLEAVRGGIEGRQQYRVQFKQREQALAEEETRVVDFEKTQDKLARKRKEPATEVSFEEIVPGDEMTIDGEAAVVRNVEYNEDGYLTNVVIEDGKRFGLMQFDPQTRGGILVDEYLPRAARPAVAADEFAPEDAPSPSLPVSPSPSLDSLLQGTESTRPRNRGETTRPQNADPLGELQRAKLAGEANQAQGRLAMPSSPKQWALQLPDESKAEFSEGQMSADHYGDDPYVYRDQWVKPSDLISNLKLEGLTYEQVVRMPSTQQYIELYKQGSLPPPITVVFNIPEGKLKSNNRRRVVAAIEAGITQIPARVEIGRASELSPTASASTPESATPESDLTPGFQHLVIDRDLEAGFMSGAGADALIDLAHRAFAAGRTFSQWAAAMVQRFGAAVRDYLAAVWDHAKRSSQTGALNFTSRLGEQLQQSQQAASRLRKPASRATPAAMASDPGAAQNAEPSPGGLSEAEVQQFTRRGMEVTPDRIQQVEVAKALASDADFRLVSEFFHLWQLTRGYANKLDAVLKNILPLGGRLSDYKNRLIQHLLGMAKERGWNFGYQDDDGFVLYIDSPRGQLSFHADHDGIMMLPKLFGNVVAEDARFKDLLARVKGLQTTAKELLNKTNRTKAEEDVAQEAQQEAANIGMGKMPALAQKIIEREEGSGRIIQSWPPHLLEDKHDMSGGGWFITSLPKYGGKWDGIKGATAERTIQLINDEAAKVSQGGSQKQGSSEASAFGGTWPQNGESSSPEVNPESSRAAAGTSPRLPVSQSPRLESAPLKAAYASALRGSSTAMVPLADVFAAAQAANPALTQEQFQAQVMADYEAGSLMLEGAGSPQEAQSAALRIDGTPVGTAVRMMVPQGFTHLDVSGQRSQAGFVINPLPALQRLAARVLPLHERGEPFRVQQLGARAILTGSPLPADVTQVLAMTENERQAVAQSAAQVGSDLQAAVKAYLDRTGQDERATWDKINAVMEGQPGALTLLTAIDPALGERSRRARNMLDDLSAAVAQTLPTGSLRDAITQNQGSWMRRGYAAFDPESGWNFDGLTKAAKAGRQIGGKDAAKILANARAYLRSQNPQNGRTLKEWNADIEADMRDLMDRNAWQSANLGGNTLRKNVSSFMRRKEIAPEIRALMGEETNPLHRFIKSAAFQAQIVARHHGQTAVRALGLQTGLFSTQRGGVYTEEIEPSENRWSGLAGVWTTPEMKAALANSSAVNREGTDLGGWLVGTVKALGNEAKLNRVALNPDSWVVNILGNVVGLVQSGDVFAWDFARRLTDARALIKSGKARPGSMQTAAESALIDAQRAMLARLRGMGVIGSSITLADIEASIPRHLLQWVAEDRARNTGLGAVKGAIMGQAAGRGLGLPGRVVGGVAGGIGGAIAGAQRLQNWQQNVADYVMTGPDALARVTGWLTNYETALAAGQNPDQAAADATTRTLNTFPNYNALPALLRQLSRLGFTGSFIAFQWEVYRNFAWNVKYAIEELSSGNAAIQARGLRRLAGIGSVAALAGGGLAALLGAAGAAASDDEERNKIWRQWFAAPWEKDAVLAFDKYDKQGVSYYNTSYLLPQMTMMELIQGASEGRDPADSASRVVNRLSEQFIAGSVHLQPLLSAFANQDRFGRRITNAEGLAGAAARVDVAAQTILEPGFADKITRLTYALRQAEKNGRKFSVEEEIKRFAGIRQVSRTWEELVKRRYSQFTYDYQGVRDDANKMLGQNLPGAPVRAVKMVNDKVIELEQQLADYERDLRRLGVPETTIKAAKKDSSLQRLNPVRVRADGRRVEAVTVR